MITFTDDGIAIQLDGWSGASPDHKGIRVRFANGGAVWVSREFLERARTIIDVCDGKALEPSSEEKSK